jgi:hypothetical protein
VSERKVTVDLRGLPAEPASSIAEQTRRPERGQVSLFVRDEEPSERAHLVLVSLDGKILAQREVVVGRTGDHARRARPFSRRRLRGPPAADLAQQFRGQYPVPTYVGSSCSAGTRHDRS